MPEILAYMEERLRERFPAGTIDERPDVGHWPAIEDPGAVTAAVRALI